MRFYQRILRSWRWGNFWKSINTTICFSSDVDFTLFEKSQLYDWLWTRVNVNSFQDREYVTLHTAKNGFINRVSCLCFWLWFSKSLCSRGFRTGFIQFLSPYPSFMGFIDVWSLAFFSQNCTFGNQKNGSKTNNSEGRMLIFCMQRYIFSNLEYPFTYSDI